MVFLNPTYLWALLGLAVPILIHLWGKKEGATIKIGSIQFLKESDPKKTSSININEWWLLLLRMLIIGVLACILANPVISNDKTTKKVTYLIEPSIVLDSKFENLVDSLRLDHDLKVLQNGFPDLDIDKLKSGETIAPDYWQLAKKMEKLSADSIVVFTRAMVAGIQGKRPEINKKINWILLNAENSKVVPVEAKRKGNDIQLLSMLSDEKHLKFEKETVSINDPKLELNNQGDSLKIRETNKLHQLALQEDRELGVKLFFSDSLAKEARYISSAFSAISNYLDIDIQLTKTRNRDSLNILEQNLVVWLSNQSMPETSGTALIYQPDSLANTIVEPGPNKNTFYLTRPLNAENIVEEHLAEKLIGLLDLHEVDEKIEKNDTRVMDRATFLPVENSKNKPKNQPVAASISKWFWLVLVLLLIMERALAAYRKQ
ncbi:BatA domain-containing protein [Christiangramia forsetii]|uniref:Membrane protein containing DUF1550 n=2 Tax=Christiangramia forsetii TaxID=411153 RepID=A0M2Q6_CHRFK|nr:BatA domain-containing protein [Christiangramia forsetii]GGG44324.1 hypothetical protein GCM10011532_30410 [Christiangramia forsetii]CAL66901.1 membrane protein containing DUF1550 [Christiangramia forsetii KT0803]